MTLSTLRKSSIPASPFTDRFEASWGFSDQEAPATPPPKSEGKIQSDVGFWPSWGFTDSKESAPPQGTPENDESVVVEDAGVEDITTGGGGVQFQSSPSPGSVPLPSTPLTQPPSSPRQPTPDSEEDTEIAWQSQTSLQKIWHRICEPPYNDNTYLELPGSLITNEEFWLIRAREGTNCWLSDNAMSVTGELLEARMGYARYGAAIVNPFHARNLWLIGSKGDADGNNYACYTHEKDLIKDKAWLLIPVNDGYESQAYEAQAGCHWSLLAVNLANAGVATGHYIDSLNPRANFGVARVILAGIMNLLGLEDIQLQAEMGVLNQYSDNTVIDFGPCGPFVMWAMYQILAAWIQSVDNSQEPFELNIGEKFGPDSGFDSENLRHSLWEMIRQARWNQEMKRLEEGQQEAFSSSSSGSSSA